MWWSNQGPVQPLWRLIQKLSEGALQIRGAPLHLHGNWQGPPWPARTSGLNKNPDLSQGRQGDPPRQEPPLPPQLEAPLTPVMFPVQWRRVYGLWVKRELCQPEERPAVALPPGSRGQRAGGQPTVVNACLLREEGCRASEHASSPLPPSQPCRYDFISTKARLWSLLRPAGCHSVVVTNPGHTLRALIKQFAFFLPLFHLIERLQSVSMRLKDYIWILRVPTQLQLSVISWSGYLSVNISCLSSQVPDLLDLVRLARLVEDNKGLPIMQHSGIHHDREISKPRSIITQGLHHLCPGRLLGLQLFKTQSPEKCKEMCVWFLPGFLLV